MRPWRWAPRRPGRGPLGGGDTWLQATEGGEARIIPGRCPRVVDLQRLPDLRVLDEKGLGGQHQVEAARHDTHHELGPAIELDRSTDDARVRAVPGFPELVAEDDDART